MGLSGALNFGSDSTNTLVIYNQAQMRDIKMLFFCGYDGFYSDGACQGGALDSAALPAYSLSFPAGNIK